MLKGESNVEDTDHFECRRERVVPEVFARLAPVPPAAAHALETLNIAVLPSAGNHKEVGASQNKTRSFALRELHRGRH